MLQRLGGKHTGLAADGASANEASAEHIGCADRKPKAELLDSQFDHSGRAWPAECARLPS
jgi:hypothetical protein